MRLFRASRKPRDLFDPLDSSASVAREGWRFNDGRTEFLYTAEVEALAILEVVARPGWESVKELTIAMIEVPDGSVVGLEEIGLSLPTNWNQRPVAANSQAIGREFLKKADGLRTLGHEILGLRVPSVISSTDCNVMLDPRWKSSYQIAGWARIPFDWLRETAT